MTMVEAHAEQSQIPGTARANPSHVLRSSRMKKMQKDRNNIEVGKNMSRAL